VKADNAVRPAELTNDFITRIRSFHAPKGLCLKNFLR